MQVNVLYFAVVRDRLGVNGEQCMVAPGATVGTLLEELATRHPALGEMLPHVRVAVDESFTTPTHVLSDGAEVALIPPVAGGSESP